MLFDHEIFLSFVLAFEVLLLRLVELIFQLSHLLLKKSTLSFQLERQLIRFFLVMSYLNLLCFAFFYYHFAMLRDYFVAVRSFDNIKHFA